MRAKEVLDLLRISAPQGAAMLVRSLPLKSGKGLVRDVSNISVIYAGFVTSYYDVVDTDCWPHNDSAYCRGFATFKRGFLRKRTGKGVNNAVCIFTQFLSCCFFD